MSVTYILGPSYLADTVVYFLPIYQFAINQGKRTVVQRVAFNVRIFV
jgi:hypothetical protein